MIDKAPILSDHGGLAGNQRIVMKTSEMVMIARQKNPNVTAAEMARELGVCRQGVSKILKDLGLPTRTIGTPRFKRSFLYAERASNRFGEMEVCADLLTFGAEVYRAVSASSSCDLIVVLNSRVLRVEVRSAQKSIGDRHGSYDVLASVGENGAINYFPGLDKFTDLPL
jgi:hypothetical protein